MRFTGTIEAKTDAKGRVFLPSAFRKALADTDGRLVLKPDVFEPCLVVYPYAVWEAEVTTLRSRLNRWNAREAMVLRQFMADVEVFELDANGRFLIPRRYLHAAAIEHAVTFIGLDDRIEIWGEQRGETPFMPREAFGAALEQLMTPPPETT